jgi:hypothetical protein
LSYVHISATLQKLPEENYCPMGENSPNLVTLNKTWVGRGFAIFLNDLLKNRKIFLDCCRCYLFLKKAACSAEEDYFSNEVIAFFSSNDPQARIPAHCRATVAKYFCTTHKTV